MRVRSLVRRGGVCRARGRYAEAERCLRRALRIAERALGRKHTEVAAVLNDLGCCTRYTASFGDAARCYRRALAIFQRAPDADRPDLATLYHNLGGLEHARGRFARGEPFARSITTNYAGLLRQMGRPADAAKLEARAGRIPTR